MHRRSAAKMIGLGALGAALAPVAGWAKQPVAMPRLSCMLWTLEKQASFERCCEMVAQAGYQGVELVGEFQRWSPEEFGRKMERLRELGLVVDAASGVKTGFAVPGAGDAFLAEFREQLAAMRRMECRRVILLSGPEEKSAGGATQRQTAIENLQRAADLAAAQQVEIVIEPIDRLENPSVYLQSVSEAFPLVSAVNRPNVRVLYDLYHEQRGSGNLLEKLEGHLEQVGLIHIADVPGRHEPGTGEIDYAVIYRQLAEMRYQGWLAMEFYPTGDPVATLRAARQMVVEAFRA